MGYRKKYKKHILLAIVFGGVQRQNSYTFLHFDIVKKVNKWVYSGCEILMIFGLENVSKKTVNLKIEKTT